jgi:hypothetical protein
MGKRPGNKRASRDDHERPSVTDTPALALTVSVLGRDVARCQFVRQDGRQCRKPSLRARDFCRTHSGGLRLVGPANPAWRHGRWSKLFPVGLRALEPPPISLSDEIGLIDIRLAGVVKRLAAGGVADEDLRDVHAALLTALTANDNGAFKTAFDRLRDIAEGRGDNSRLWRQALDLIERRSRLVELERRHAMREHNALTRTTASALASALLESVCAHVRDRETLAAIAAEFRQLIDVRGIREREP